MNFFRKPRARAQRNHGEFQCFNWMRGVADDRVILPLRRFILMRLCLYRNSKNGCCYPSYDRIHADLGVDRSTVLRAIGDGVRHGWPKKRRRGPTSNSFTFNFPLKDVAPEPPLYANDVAPVPQRYGTGATQTGEANGRDNSLGELSLQRESDDRFGLWSPPSRAAPDGTARGEDQEERLLSRSKSSPPSEPVGPKKTSSKRRASPPPPGESSPPNEPNLRKEEFAELQHIWSVRPWPNTPDDIAAAKTAYAAAAAEVGGDVILAGARAAVAAPAYRGDKARYLEPLAKWLVARSWEKPPPQPARSAPHRRSTNNSHGKPSKAQMMFELGQRRAAQRRAGQ